MLIFGGIICIASAFIGICIKRIYRGHMVFCRDAEPFIELVIREIESSRTPFIRIVEEYVQANSNDLVKGLNMYIDMCKSGVINSEKITNIEWKIADKKDDIIVKNLLSGIGKYDSKTQLESVRKSLDLIRIRLDYQTKKYNKEGAMAFNLSVLIGLVVLIIFA